MSNSPDANCVRTGLRCAQKYLCICIACSSSQFRCESGECKYRSYRCNGYCNCNDCSDERNCSKSAYDFYYLVTCRLYARFYICYIRVNGQHNISKQTTHDYLLRPRRHNRELSCKSNYDDNNFITRMLYTDTY